jgi:hypothetical protein
VEAAETEHSGGVFKICSKVIQEGCGLPLGAEHCTACEFRGEPDSLDTASLRAPCMAMTMTRCE